MSQSGVRNLTEGKIFRQLIQLALPIMATNFIQMLYTLTDMAWVGRLGSREMAAIGAVGLLTWLTSAFALLPKVAAEISIAHSIGKKQLDKAKVYASHATTISLLLGMLFAALLIFGAPLIVSFYKLEPYIESLAIEYLRIVSSVLPFYYLSYTFAGVYNGAGRTTIPFYLMASGLVCNMILDPLLIFGIGGIEGLGTRGAAMATLFSQVLVCLLFIWQMKQRNGILNRFPYFVRLQREYTVRVFKLGTPIALTNCFMASISFVIARIASVYGGHLGVMSQTTGSQIEGITWNTSNGFSTALSTFVAQNYAAGKIERTQKAYRYVLAFLLSLGVVITVGFIFFGKHIFGLFVLEEEARIAGGEYLFITAFCQVFMMLEITALGMWNGYGKTLPPALISVVLNLLRIPIALWLAPTYGINGVWISLSATAILKGIISALWWQFTPKHSKTD